MTILPTTSQGSKHSHLLDSLTNHDKSDLQSTTLHSVTHLVLDWTGKIQFTPNQTLSRWSITLAFSNLEDQTYTRWVKLGISQLHSTFMTLIERQIQSSRRNSIFRVFANPIMRKTATLFLSASNLKEEPLALYTPRRFLAKWRSHGKMSLLSALGSVLIKTMLMKSPAEVLWCTKTVLVKTSTKIVAGRHRDAQKIEVLRAYTLRR